MRDDQSLKDLEARIQWAGPSRWTFRHFFANVRLWWLKRRVQPWPTRHPKIAEELLLPPDAGAYSRINDLPVDYWKKFEPGLFGSGALFKPSTRPQLVGWVRLKKKNFTGRLRLFREFSELGQEPGYIWRYGACNERVFAGFFPTQQRALDFMQNIIDNHE